MIVVHVLSIVSSSVFGVGGWVVSKTREEIILQASSLSKGRLALAIGDELKDVS